MKIMKIIHGLVAAILATGLTLIPTVANADCRIFQHRDYGGSGYTLHHLERMIMVSGENTGCTTNGHSGGCESTIYEPSWNDQVSSFKVTGGCTLTLWQHVNQGGARFRSSRSYLYVGDAWNDQASEALCMCPG
jgi:syncollin